MNKAMALYEVHYQDGETFGEELVEAEGPEQAWKIFVQQQREQDGKKVAICVIRH
ncbi:MAG: hypothetical protein JXR59_05595 [Desulfuromonadaceae bacterium]|nr:hypothetical protein [Desulfuromonadaceae bacterium]